MLFSSDLKAGDYERAFEALKNKDYEKAIYFFSFFASNGDSVAQYNMGVLYRDGHGVDKNVEVALSWFLLAADQQHMLANYATAKLLEQHKTLGVSQDRNLHYYKEAAFLGHAIAPLEIGNYYYFRDAESYDLVRAVVWWMVSLERNAPGASENILKVTPDLGKTEMDSISKKLAECDNTTLRACLTVF